MAIKLRQGNSADFNGNRLVPGEAAVILDEEEMYIKFTNGTKKVMTEEDAELFIAAELADVEEAIDDLEDEVSDKLNKNNPVGYGSLSFQRRSETTVGSDSVTLGLNNKASGSASAAIGAANEATGDAAVGLGYMNKAEGDNSAAIGNGTRSIDDGCVSVGRFNSVHLPGGPDRVFQVGNGTDDSNRSTAFEIEENGTARFSGNIDAPMFKYQSGTAVQIGVDGSRNPVKRLTVRGTDTSDWISGYLITDLESSDIMIINLYGFVKFEWMGSFTVPISNILQINEDHLKLNGTLPDHAQSATAKYCVTVEYILLS